jgi:hypothetical protein
MDNLRKRALPRVGDEHIEFAVQAYADDVIFISQELEGVQRMLGTLALFVG